MLQLGLAPAPVGRVRGSGETRREYACELEEALGLMTFLRSWGVLLPSAGVARLRAARLAGRRAADANTRPGVAVGDSSTPDAQLIVWLFCLFCRLRSFLSMRVPQFARVVDVLFDLLLALFDLVRGLGRELD